MRILHFADIHIGVETYSRPDPETGLPSRLVDVLTAFDQLVDCAIEDGVDLVVFAGDAYKNRDPSQTHQREFAKRIRRLVDHGIPIFLVIGNHDLPNALSRATALEIFDTLGVPNVHVATRTGTYIVKTRSGQPMQIVALPWPSQSWLLTRDEWRNKTIEQIDDLIEEKINAAIGYESARLDPDLPAILTAHIAMNQSIVKTGSEQWMTVGHFPQLLKSSLSPDAFDYVALGHHHFRQSVGNYPPIYYAGSLQRVDFGEEGDPKGFYIAEIDAARRRGERLVGGEPKFHEVYARRFVTVTVTPKAEDPTPEVLAAIRRSNAADAIVRVQVRLTGQQNALFREAEVRHALADAHYVASISRDVTDERRRRLPSDAQVSTSMTPLAALRLYLEQKGVAPERRELLLQYAQRLIQEQEQNA